MSTAVVNHGVANRGGVYFFALCLASIPLTPRLAFPQDTLPTELRAKAALTQTVAELARRKGAFDRARTNFIHRGQFDIDAWNEWYSSLDQVGNFVLGYVVASIDNGRTPLGSECGTVNGRVLGESVIDRLIADTSKWRENWVVVVRAWLKDDILSDEQFRLSVCQRK